MEVQLVSSTAREGVTRWKCNTVAVVYIDKRWQTLWRLQGGQPWPCTADLTPTKWLLLEAQSLSGWGLGEEGEGALSTLQLGRKYLKWLISRWRALWWAKAALRACASDN